MPASRLLWLRSWLPHFTRNSLAFGAARFSYSVLTTIFYFYITTVFTSIYQITDTHFYVSHVVYAIWNAINDPSFAWLLDNTTATGAARRLPAIKYGGPLWSLAFLVPWWPWSSVPGSWLVGAHFCFSMCLFDSFVSYVSPDAATDLPLDSVALSPEVTFFMNHGNGRECFVPAHTDHSASC